MQERIDDPLASFVAAVLNAQVVNEQIKPFQSHGLLGERDIEKKVLELPIPVFDSNDQRHSTLASLGKRAEEQVKSFLVGYELPKTLASRRALVRTEVDKTLSEINPVVKELLLDV